MRCETLVKLIEINAVSKGKCPFAKSCDGTGVPTEDCRLVAKLEAVDDSRTKYSAGQGHPQDN